MPFEYEQKIEAQDGNNLVLTIDSNVQSILEEGLKQGIIDNDVQEGAVAVLMNVKTGAILGLAVEGSFDPNDPFTLMDEEVQKEIDALPEDEQDKAYNNALQKQWRNKAVSDTYYPGSVFKMCTGSMALEEGVVTKRPGLPVPVRPRWRGKPCTAGRPATGKRPLCRGCVTPATRILCGSANSWGL